jgi:arabinofuranosyltransferase
MTLPDQKYYQPKWLIASLLFLYAIVVLITAWLSDDAYITFRTVDNFKNGHGLTWNIGERVQTYTHPLWMFLHSGLYLFSNEFYFTSITLSLIISLIAFVLILNKISASLFNSIIAGLILIFSKAYVDYSTSGLENPLTNLLIVLFYIVYFSQSPLRKKLFHLSLIASFAALNRLDIMLILLPSLGIQYFKSTERGKNFIVILGGFIPLILWEFFSLFYYGFLFPNTAYAKLNTGISRLDLIEQGFFYLQDSLYLDPLTFFALITGIMIPFFLRKEDFVPLAFGILLYIIYLINIGGDFMSGRFLSAPLLLSVIIFSRIELKSIRIIIVCTVIIIGLGFLSPRPNVLSTPQYSLGPKIIHAFRFGPTIIGMHNGITDERFWYYENTGLLNNLFEQKLEQHPWVKHALTFKKSSDELVVKSSLGLFGFYIGKNVHVVDQYALTEPLLARLPSTEYWLIGHEKPKSEKFWRIGHFPRKIPDGYLETIKTGKNKISNPGLAKYYEKLSIIIKGELWDFNRLKEIWNFNIGKYDHLLVEYHKTLYPTSQ